jgi:hypothetical protein
MARFSRQRVSTSSLAANPTGALVRVAVTQCHVPFKSRHSLLSDRRC